jgi:hypothetical protein
MVFLKQACSRWSAVDVNTIQKQHMKVNVEVHRTRLAAHQDRFLPAANRSPGLIRGGEYRRKM